MKKIVLLLVMAITLAMVGCENLATTAWGIYVENKSDEDVYFVVGLEERDGKYYPTTDFIHSGRGVLVEVGQRKPIDYTPYRDVKCSKDAPIAIFVISREVYERYDRVKISQEEMYLKKFEGTCGTKPYEIIYP